MSDTIKITISRRTAVALTSLVLGGAGAALMLGQALADPSTSSVANTPYRLPYDGFLEIDGQRASGQVKIKFSLHESLTGAAAPWTETQVVDVRDGRFSVGLGAATPIDLRILSADRLWLSLTIIEDDGAGGEREVALAGRHQLEPMPHAAWTANTANFLVRGDLDVAGAATLEQTVTLTAPPTFDADVRAIAAATVSGNMTTQDRIFSNGTNSDFRGPVEFRGGLDVERLFTEFVDGAGATFALGGVDAVNDGTGVELRALTNPPNGEPIFRVLSSGGAQRLRVEHAGEVSMDNGLRVAGSAALGATTVDDLSVNGNLPITVEAVQSLSQSANTSDSTELGDSAFRMCYLTWYRGGDMENNDRVLCRVYDDGSKWQLEALTSQATGTCAAQCISW